MKLILSFLISISVFGQSWELPVLFSNDGATYIDPLTYDANTIALYDGDLELTTSGWGDQSANNYDLTFTDSPTVNSSALNGHNTVTFNGTSEYGTKTDPPSFTQPITIYIVIKQITWENNDRFLSAIPQNSLILGQTGTSPNMFIFSGTLLNSDPDLAVDTYGIITCVFNGTSSEIRTNDNASVVGNAGTGVGTGIRVAALNSASTNFGNCEIAYIIYRGGADDTTTQDLFIASLQNRFGISF